MTDHASMPPAFAIRPATPADAPARERFGREHWGADFVVAHGMIFRPVELPGLLAVAKDAIVGALTYRREESECEIITLDAAPKHAGIGTALLEALVPIVRATGCRRLWLVTTNDNLDALRFYQRRGFALVRVRRGALAISRRLKPQIPPAGAFGIPLRDEIELAMDLS